MKNSQYVRQAQYKKGFVVPLLLAIIAVLVIGGGVYVYNNKKAEAPAVVDTGTQQTDTQTSLVNTQTTKSNIPLNWKTEFGTINWQESVMEGCYEDFQILKTDTSTDPQSCPVGTIGKQTRHHLTEQEKKLYGFIKTVVERSIPAGYALGGAYGDSRNVWVEDLNNDGQMDMAFSLITPPDTSTSWRDYTQPTNTVLMVVTPTSLDGTSRRLAEIGGKELAAISPDGLPQPLAVENTIDFDHDGIKELLIPGYANKPTSAIFKIDYSKGIISRLQERTSAGEMQPAYIISAGGFGYLVEGFLKDVDKDSVDDLVYHNRRFTDGSNKTIETATLDVFKWNGTFFDYSKSLSDQLKISFDPSKDIP